MTDLFVVLCQCLEYNIKSVSGKNTGLRTMVSSVKPVLGSGAVRQCSRADMFDEPSKTAKVNPMFWPLFETGNTMIKDTFHDSNGELPLKIIRYHFQAKVHIQTFR